MISAFTIGTDFSLYEDSISISLLFVIKPFQLSCLFSLSFAQCIKNEIRKQVNPHKNDSLQARCSPDRTVNSYEGKGKTLRRDIVRRIERIQAEQRKINQRENERTRKELMIYWGFLPKEALSDDESSVCITSEENVTESKQTASSSSPLQPNKQRKLASALSKPPSLKRKTEEETYHKKLNVIKDGLLIQESHKPPMVYYNLRPRKSCSTFIELVNGNEQSSRKKSLKHMDVNGKPEA